jgi:hypothetical protein
MLAHLPEYVRVDRHLLNRVEDDTVFIVLLRREYERIQRIAAQVDAEIDAQEGA